MAGLGVAAAALVALVVTGVAGKIWTAASSALRGDEEPLNAVILPVRQVGGGSEDVFGPRGVVIPNSAPLPATADELPDWYRVNEGVPANVRLIGIESWGPGRGRVQLLGIDVEVVEREEPLKGTFHPPPVAGPPNARHLFINLDDQRPAATREQVDDGKPPWNFPLWVDDEEREVFLIYAGTSICSCSFVLRIAYSVDGKAGSLRLTEADGRPFRVTAVGRATRGSPLPWNQ